MALVARVKSYIAYFIRAFTQLTQGVRHSPFYDIFFIGNARQRPKIIIKTAHGHMRFFGGRPAGQFPQYEAAV